MRWVGHSHKERRQTDRLDPAIGRQEGLPEEKDLDDAEPDNKARQAGEDRATQVVEEAPEIAVGSPLPRSAGFLYMRAWLLCWCSWRLAFFSCWQS